MSFVSTNTKPGATFAGIPRLVFVGWVSGIAESAGGCNSHPAKMAVSPF